MTDNHKNQSFLKFHLSLQQRLLSAFFLVAVPILAIVFIVSMILIYSSGRERVLSEQKAALNSVGRQFEAMLEETKTLSKDIIFNNSVQENLSMDQAAANILDVKYFINNFIANKDFVDSVVITKNDSTIFSTEHAFTDISSFDNIAQKNWFPKLQSLEAPYMWDISEGYFMFARKIYDLRDYKTQLGYEMIYLNQKYIDHIWNTCGFGTTTNILLMDASDEILLSYAATKDETADYTAHIHDDNQGMYVTSTYPLSEKGWTLYMITPFSEANGNIRLLQYEMAALLALIILILLLVSITSSSAMAKPIINLARTMDVFHGETHTETVNDFAKYKERQDEVGQIYRSYENMTTRMDYMINEIYIKTLEKRDAELALMQSQINPHFLYNTLDSINWMALANDQEEISEMVMALSDTFRLSLTKNNSSFILLKDEMAYIQSYLVLQKYRFKDKLNVYFDIDDACNHLYIPKFICQPIIENALKHGLAKLDEEGLYDSGELFIQALMEEDRLLINIINDGVGIDMDKINSHLDFDPSKMEYLAFEKGGYGLQNIHRRIRIICGSEYGVSFREIREEDEPVKTVCTLTLPIKEHENEDKEEDEV